MSGLWVVTELSVSLPTPRLDGEAHPEQAPVGPFESREEADRWAFDHIRAYGSGSWSVAPLTPPSPHPALST